MKNLCLLLPADFENFEWEVKAKGYFGEASISIEGKTCRLSFYDPIRLAQEIEGELQHGSVFFEPNLIVIPSVTRTEMEQAVELLVKKGQVAMLFFE